MDDKNIFIRTEWLIGKEGLEKLKQSRVAVFGVGGVGSYAVEALARSGVGSLTLIDHDVVSYSNINRQLLALHSTVGRYKAQVMAERVKDINPEAEAINMEARYPDDNHNWDYACVVDAVDTTSTKLRLALEAKNRGIALVASMGAGNRLDPSKFKAGDIYETQNCPLAKTMRGLYRKNGIESLRVIYSTELPVKVPNGIGSISYAPAAAGLMLAAEAIKMLIKQNTGKN